MFPDTWPPAAAIAAGPGAQLTGTEEDRVDQGLVVPEKLFESSAPCQKLLGVIMPEVC